MGEQTLTLLDAVRLAKEAEQKAAAMYASGAIKTTNPLARQLFERLAKFEELHYKKLVELETSLFKKRAYIDYEGGAELPIPATAEAKRMGDFEKTSAAKVIKWAISFETAAEERYRALAERTSDPQGRQMFERLAKEEHNHYLVLENAFYNLSSFRPLA